MDTIFFDNAIDDSKASSYVNSDTTNTEISYSNDGTTITRTLASYSTWYDVKIGNSTEWRDSSIDYCIEFDVIFTKPSGSNGNVFLLFGDGSVSMGGIMDSTGAGHVKLETDGTALKPYWNETHISARDTTMTSNKGFRFQIYNNCSCTFKNLKIYPI